MGMRKGRPGAFKNSSTERPVNWFSESHHCRLLYGFFSQHLHDSLMMIAITKTAMIKYSGQFWYSGANGLNFI
jgi:hypothetical protein